jgi:hypothetical protein
MVAHHMGHLDETPAPELVPADVGVRHRKDISTTNAFLVAALIPVITGTGIGGTEEL